MPFYRGRGTHGQVVELLGQRIVAGELAENATLDLRALGEELEVSLSVLREAVKVLTAKGLLDARQKRGTFIRPRAAWNLLDADMMRWHAETQDSGRLLRELLEVRTAIEPTAAQLAALRRTEGDLDALRAALSRMEAARTDPEAMAAADLAFHRALLHATGNEMLARMDVFLEPGLHARDLLVHTRLRAGDRTPAAHGGSGALGHGDGGDDPVPSHAAVLSAVEAGDAAAARAAMLDLLAKSETDQRRVLPDPTEQESP